MEHKDTFLLEDIIEYCDNIALTLERFRYDRKAFDSDFIFENACSFQVFQIGELVTALSGKFKQSHPEMPWRQIIGMRNLIAHDYGNTNKDSLWHTINIDIPQLKAFCENIIKDGEN